MTGKPLGAILTGGRSSRMGRDKADVVVAGRPMLDLVASALSVIADHIVLLGPDRHGWECWPDSVHAQGPLAGIATALARTTFDRVALVAVDHPFVRPGFLQMIIGIESDLPVVPVDETGVRQVTCAIYPRSIADAADDEARTGGSIQTLLDRVSFRPVAPGEWRSWGEDGRSWFSVDSEEALALGEAAYPEPQP
ncbi:MAG: molybdenum cofactor guanylyltransferase, partial [Acidimicrobiia bacterium]